MNKKTIQKEGATEDPMDKSLVPSAEEYVKNLLSKDLPEYITYHNLAHTLFVRDNALLIGRLKNLTDEELQVLELAALFHDTGFVKTYHGHETESKKISEDFLNKKGVGKEIIQQVHSCIDATVVGQYPTGNLEAIIKDADLASLGRTDFLKFMKKLRVEWEEVLNYKLDDESWYTKEIAFLKDHYYFTKEARDVFEKQKNINRKSLKKELKQLKKKGKGKDKKEDKKDFTSILATSKSAQMMFKTALRNHIDLTNIADNKANIMLSINALLVTIMIPLLPSQLAKNQFLIYPASILLITCVIAIIYGTLVTRPIKMTGHTNLEKLGEGTTNLFFFGNFYSMSLSTYHEAIDRVLNDEKILDKSIVNDLYFLGEALGNKYSMLRKCYLVFMIGMTLSVTAFALAFWISG